MVGWILQPDINVPVYLPIASVDPQHHEISVTGSYGFMVPSGYNAPRFRIYAPPGADRSGPEAGTFSRFTSAGGSRCLFGGYRYESPLLGFYDSPSKQTVLRQTGSNFAGQYYTLYRNYDPVLMKFTTQDPAAQFFHNLNAYCANNPASYHDPDGLSEVSEYWGNYLRGVGQDEIDEMRANGQHTRAGINMGVRNFFAGGADLLFGVIHGGYDYTNWLTTGEDMSLTKTASGINKRWVARADTINQSDAAWGWRAGAFVVLSFGDLTGSTQIFLEGGAGINSVTGSVMTEEERAAAATEGGLFLLSLARGAKRRPTEGGPVGELKTKWGWDRNHAPAKEGMPELKKDGPGFRMRTTDHLRTASHGRQGKSARAYRAQQRQLIEQGQFRKAQAMDIRDTRQQFGGRYDRGIAEMLRYTEMYMKGKGHRWPTIPSGGPVAPTLPTLRETRRR